MNIKIIWAQKLREIQEEIDNTEIGKDGRLMQLYKKKELLEMAFGRVK